MFVILRVRLVDARIGDAGRFIFITEFEYVQVSGVDDGEVMEQVDVAVGTTLAGKVIIIILDA